MKHGGFTHAEDIQWTLGPDGASKTRDENDTGYQRKSRVKCDGNRTSKTNAAQTILGITRIRIKR